MTTIEIYQAVARGDMTAEQGAELMMQNRTPRKETMKLAITETKLKSTIGFLVAFLVAYGPEVVTWIGGLQTSPQWLRDVAKGLGVLIGVLTSKEGVAILNKFVAMPTVIPLLDGSSVVQVKPPTVPGGQSLSHVAVDPTPFATNTAAVVPVATMQTGDVPGKVLPMVEPTPITADIRPRDKGAAVPGVLLVIVLAAATAFGVLALDRYAHAADASPQLGFSSQHLSFQPASALAYQLNLKTGDANRAAALVGFSGIYDGWVVPVGGAVLCGVGAATSGPNAIQCNLGLLVSNFGAVLIGVQEYKDPNGGGAIYQGLLGVAGTLNFSGSPSYLKAAVAK